MFLLHTDYILLAIGSLAGPILGKQLSFDHWRVDLEYRLALYRTQRETLKQLIDTAIQPHQGPLRQVTGPSRLHFKELIINNGALVLDSKVAKSNYRKMFNDTQVYMKHIGYQVDELINQLNKVKSKLINNTTRYIYKDRTFNVSGPKDLHTPNWIGPIRAYENVQLEHANGISVGKVMKKILFKNVTHKYDYHQKRIFFEGTKTFYKTTFNKILRSGCCDRLKPLSINRIMVRSANQQILSPFTLMLAPTSISNFTVGKISRNPPLNMGFLSQDNHSNTMTTNDLLDLNYGRVLYTGLDLIFNHVFIGNRIRTSNAIGIMRGSDLKQFNWLFDINPNLYLMNDYNHLMTTQRISSAVSFGSLGFMSGIKAHGVNSFEDFCTFIQRELVRIDKPANLSGSLRMTFNYNSNIPLLTINGSLIIGQINGLSVPNDLIVQQAIPPDWPIVVRSSKMFTNPPVVDNIIVQGCTSGIRIPDEVVSVLDPDLINIEAFSSITFQNGIHSHDIILSTDNRNIDKLNLDDSIDSASSLITRSSFSNSLHGVRLLRSQLTVNELILNGRDPNQGLLNGMNIQDILRLNESTRQDLPILGRKKFVGPVRISECSFFAINHIENWTNHMIALIGAPQYINTRLILPKEPYNASRIGLRVNHLTIANEMNQRNFHVRYDPSAEFLTLHRVLYDEELRVHGRPVDHRMNSYRIGNQLILPNQLRSTINGISLLDVLTYHSDGPVNSRIKFVNRVGVRTDLDSNMIYSSGHVGNIDIVQFDKYRIPTQFYFNHHRANLNADDRNQEIKFNNLPLENNLIDCDIRTETVNGVQFDHFIKRIMSKSRHQTILSKLIFNSSMEFESPIYHTSHDNSIANGDVGGGLVINGFKISSQKLMQIVFDGGLNVTEIAAMPQSRIICDNTNIAPLMAPAPILSETTPKPSLTTTTTTTPTSIPISTPTTTINANTNENLSTSQTLRATDQIGGSRIDGRVRLFPDLIEDTLTSRGSFFMSGELTTFKKLKVLGNVHVGLVNGLKLSERYLLNKTVRLPPYEQSRQLIKNHIIFDKSLNITGDLNLMMEAPPVEVIKEQNGKMQEVLMLSDDEDKRK